MHPIVLSTGKKSGSKGRDRAWLLYWKEPARDERGEREERREGREEIKCEI